MRRIGNQDVQKILKINKNNDKITSGLIVPRGKSNPTPIFISNK